MSEDEQRDTEHTKDRPADHVITGEIVKQEECPVKMEHEETCHKEVQDTPHSNTILESADGETETGVGCLDVEKKAVEQKTQPSEEQKVHSNSCTTDENTDVIISSDGNLVEQAKEQFPTQVEEAVTQKQPSDKLECLPSQKQSKTADADGGVVRYQGKDRSPNIGQKDHKDHEKTLYRSISDTYDVITRKEVQSLSEWDSIHKDCLNEIPPIDPGAVYDLERKANEVAGNLDHLLGTLGASLKSMSVTGVQSIDTYKTSVDHVQDTVDVSIKSMYTLIAKCEELDSYMGPLYTMSSQIKEIRRTLDVFESVCK